MAKQEQFSGGYSAAFCKLRVCKLLTSRNVVASHRSWSLVAKQSPYYCGGIASGEKQERPRNDIVSWVGEGTYIFTDPRIGSMFGHGSRGFFASCFAA